MMCLLNPWNNKQSFGFLMFSRSLEMQNRAKKMDLFAFNVQLVLILAESGAFHVKFANFLTLKLFFSKFEIW